MNELLKDISARLPYGLKAEYDGAVIDIIAVNSYGEIYPDRVNYTLPLDEVKPFLRPMSSMTDKEQTEWHNTTLGQRWITENNIERCVDWLNSHHFDYRGLIEKGLALEAPQGMYN